MRKRRVCHDMLIPFPRIYSFPRIHSGARQSVASLTLRNLQAPEGAVRLRGKTDMEASDILAYAAIPDIRLAQDTQRPGSDIEDQGQHGQSDQVEMSKTARFQAVMQIGEPGIAVSDLFSQRDTGIDPKHKAK